MKFRKVLALVLMLILILVILLTAKLFGKVNIDNVLISQKYKISSTIGTEYVYVIIYDNDRYTIKELAINDFGKNSIDIPKGKKFIVSFHANATVTYTWNITNDISGNVIKLTDKKRARIDGGFHLFNSQVKCGESADRQNFYFNTIEKGSESLKFEYHSQDPSQSQRHGFNIILEVNIM